jgi:hypothetical protein
LKKEDVHYEGTEALDFSLAFEDLFRFVTSSFFVSTKKKIDRFWRKTKNGCYLQEGINSIILKRVKKV